MRLSIIIPTRNRENDLRGTLDAFCEIIQTSRRRRDVELVCVNNFSKDGTAEIGRSFTDRFDFVRYEHQVEECRSAETSAFAAAEFAHGQYVWLFGDDDTPIDGCIDLVIEQIETSSPSFVLLNLLFDFGKDDDNHTYINALSESILYPSGLAFFKVFGLTTAVTTISCLCYKRDDFDVNLFKRLASESEIYSHSFAVFANFFDKSVLFLATPVLKYKPTNEAEELVRLCEHSTRAGRPAFYAFCEGLAKLIVTASAITSVPIKEICGFEEIVIHKHVRLVRHSMLWCMLPRSIVFQWQERPEYFTIKDMAAIDLCMECFEDPIASVCWTACQQLVAKDSLIDDSLISHLILDNVAQYDQKYFQAIPPRKGTIESIYFQHGTMPRTFKITDSVLNASALPTLSIIVCKTNEQSLARFQDYIKRSGLSSWAEWLICTPHSEMKELARSIQKASGKFTFICRDTDYLLPQTLAFALGLLGKEKHQAILFNTRCDDANQDTRTSIHGWIGDQRYPALFDEADLASLVVKSDIIQWHNLPNMLIFKSGIAFGNEVKNLEDLAFLLLHRFRDEKCAAIDYPLYMRVPAKEIDVGARQSRYDEIARMQFPRLPVLASAIDNITLPPFTALALRSVNEALMIRLEHDRVSPILSIDEIYAIFRSASLDWGTPAGALLLENILLLMNITLIIENGWRFGIGLRSSWTSLLLRLNHLIARPLEAQKYYEGVARAKYIKARFITTIRSGRTDFIMAYDQKPKMGQSFRAKSRERVRMQLPGFDPQFYLKMYPDVAKAGMDPVQHFNEHGWKEHRNPCEYFNTAGYLQFNGDVNQADINPLEHFVRYGVLEGRQGWFA